MTDNKKIEAERKFLLKRKPDLDLSKFYSETVLQSYYPKDNDKWGRVEHIKTKSATIETGGLFVNETSVKYIQNEKEFLRPGVCDEFEKEITESEYEELFGECVKFVKKTRYWIPDPSISDTFWELDIYHNLDMVVVEVEADESILFDIQLPEFIKEVLILEVTQFREFSNERLSVEFNKAL